MPIPFLIAGGAVLAGAAGVGSAINGAMKVSVVKNKIESANRKHESNRYSFERKVKSTDMILDDLGELQVEILASFEKFSDVIEKIQNRPKFHEINKDRTELSKIDDISIRNAYLGANLILSSISGAAIGTLGGYAVSGMATSAVMALETASTGTAISELSGVAATKATLAAIGGGSIAAGGGGIALGTTILGGATLGVGLLAGGIILNSTGNKMLNDADKVWDSMKSAEKKMDKIIIFLDELSEYSKKINENSIYIK